MHCKEEYKALLAKINAEKELYAKKEAEVSVEVETSIQYTKENIEKWKKRTVLYFIIACVCLWPIYYFFTYFNIKKYIFLVLTIFLLGLIALLIVEKIYINKMKKYDKIKQPNQLEKEEIINKINLLNKQIESLIVSVITINEHYNELSNITNEDLLQKKWSQYTKQLIMAINYKYNYSPTYTDYQEYFSEYEKYLERKNNED